MKLTLKSHIAQGLLAAGLVLGVASANAAGGMVKQEQESLVTAGMSAGQVQQTVGSPDHIAQYGNESGRTWIYRVPGAGVSPYDVTFDINFGADGRVTAVREDVSADFE